MRCASSSSAGAVAVADDVLRREVVPRAGAEQQVEVGVAGGPRVAEQLAAEALHQVDAPVAQHVERLAQRRAPRLVPALLAAGLAPAVLLPPADAVGARPGARPAPAPRGSGGASRAGRRAAAWRPRRRARADGEGVGDVVLGALVVVAEGLAVGGGGHQPAVGAGVLDRGAHDVLAGGSGEGERVGERAVVDDQVDGEVGALGVAPAVRAG